MAGKYVSGSSNGPGNPPDTFDTTATMEPINSTLPMVTQDPNSAGSRSSTNTANEHLRRIQEMHSKSSIPSSSPITSTTQQPTTQQSTTQQPMFYQNAPVISVVPSQAEIRGRVRRINPRSPRNSTIFWVWTEKLNREFKCRANFFCPVREGDAISGIVQFSDLNNKQEELVFIQPPFVEIGMDKDSVSRTFLKFLRGTGFGNTKAYNLYDRFSELARRSEDQAQSQEQSGILFGDQASGSLEQVNLPDVDNKYNLEGMVCNLISEMAEVWNATEDESTLIPITTVITTEQAKKLMTNWYKQCNLRRLYLLGLNNREIRECHCSCDEIYRKCLKNPFTVVQISMDKCHTIWNRIGKKYTKEQERCGLIARRLYENSDRKSWTGTPSKILASNFEDCSRRIPEMRADYDIITEMFTVYLPYQHEVETAVSRKIMEWVKNSPLPDELRDKKSSNKIDDPNFLKTTLDDSQKEAIRGALINSISIITGIAGSGKTTVIGEVIHNLELMEIPYMVASFTGKAVARIREVIKRKTPATMHRLIAKAGSVPPFKYLIIDEASMVTADLFYEFGKTFKWDFRVLFVGDPNQLQPIGWGDLFSQMISSGLVPTYSLNTNHRSDTDGTNGIKINSEGLIRYRQSIKTQGNPHENNEYEEPFSFSMAPNFSMLEGNMENVFDIIRAMYQRQVDSSRLTIITPYNRDLQELNSTYQQIYNDGKPSIIDCKSQVWMVGDRVMMKDNNYEINVMNGEEGIVKDIIEDGDTPKIVIEFEDGAHHKFNTIYKDEDYEESPADTYKLKKELTVKQLQHSFAVTVHKSQGSEWDFVIIYVPPNFNTVTSFLNANLVYTSITRARRAVWMIGDITSYNSSAIVSPPYRCDNLAERMKRISQSNE
jgi:AAA domain/UvrD-like helicase C-terminal domain/ATP-dependent RecD-like DNA helicase SH3 domain